MKKLSIITILLLLLASVLWAADATYGPKFYRTDGGDKAVVASGGSIVVESGGALTLDSGSTLTGSGTMNLTSPTITGLDAAFPVSSKVFTAGEDWELSATEAKSLLLTASSGSGTPSIIAPSTSGKVYMFRNGAGVAITLKRSGATGISVASGKTAILMDNGTDYVRITADVAH